MLTITDNGYYLVTEYVTGTSICPLPEVSTDEEALKEHVKFCDDNAGVIKVVNHEPYWPTPSDVNNTFEWEKVPREFWKDLGIKL